MEALLFLGSLLYCGVSDAKKAKRDKETAARINAKFQRRHELREAKKKQNSSNQY